MSERIHPKRLVEGWQQGHNDCTVNALAASAKIPYQEAFKFIEACGRPRRKGIRSEIVLDAWNQKNVQPFTRVHNSLIHRPLTCREFAARYPRGRFYVRKRRHAFAIVDGKIVDHSATPRTRIIDAWSFGPALEARPTPITRVPVQRTVRTASFNSGTFNKQEFIEQYKATGKPSQKKIPCSVTGQMVTMFGTNLHARVKKFGTVEKLLANFVCRDAKRLARY